MNEECAEAIRQLESSGIEFKTYNNGIQINAHDIDGIIHTFYPTTGTVVIHASNDRKNRRTKSFSDQSIEKFIKGMKMHITKLYFTED